MKNATLSLDIETLVELTPEDQKGLNGGFKTVSSPMPTPPVHATPTAHTPPLTSSPLPTPPVHKKHHKHHHHHH